MAPTTKLQKMIVMAQELDRESRYDLADNIDKTLNEIILLASSKPITKPKQSDCGCGSVKTAGGKFVDYTENTDIQDILKSIGTQEDVDDFALYQAIHGNEFPTGNSPLESSEMIKVLALEADMYNQLLMDTEDEKEYHIISERLEEINNQINKLAENHKRK